jgi:hypothetical protein
MRSMIIAMPTPAVAPQTKRSQSRRATCSARSAIVPSSRTERTIATYPHSRPTLEATSGRRAPIALTSDVATMATGISTSISEGRHRDEAQRGERQGDRVPQREGGDETEEAAPLARS